MTTRNNGDEGWKLVFDTISKFLIPFALVWLTWQQGQMSKLEERIYQLQATSVTESKLLSTKQEIISFVDTRIGDINNKMDLILKQMEIQQKYSNK